MDMKRRILSCFLAFCMIFALLPAPAQAAGNAENAAPTVTATVQHAKTGQITAQIEAYMTDPANKTRTVKPCDIIFLIEQSKFMNTQNGSANSGDERAEILGAIERLLDGMPKPTTGGEHRIAIAGYGRINNPGIGDSYDAALYPGTLPSSNESLNTGYYTKDGFHSKKYWTECDSQDEASLPKLPSGYLPDPDPDGKDGYDDVFLSVSDAKQIIDAGEMVPWYAGAARMDAGLTITEQLAEIAKEHKAAGEERNLIVCIAASSLPYQNNGTYQQLRPKAAIAAAKIMGIASENIARSLSSFKGIRHRIEPVGETDGVKYVDDSKGTNVDATIKAVGCMKDETVLLLGGKDKGYDYDKLFVKLRSSSVVHAVLYGENRFRLFESALRCGFDRMTLCVGFEFAVRLARMTRSIP